MSDPETRKQPPRPKQDGQKDSPFERFESLTKRLVAVPKKEIERKAKAHQRRKVDSSEHDWCYGPVL